MGVKFYICDTDAQNFIFGIIVSARLNLDLSLCGTTARMLYDTLNLDCRGA